MAPSVYAAKQDPSTDATSRDTGTTSPSNASVPSLDFSDDMVTPGAAEHAAAGEEYAIATTKTTDVDRAEMPKTKHSSSSSLWCNSDDGVVTGGDIDAEINYGDKNLALKNCWEAVKSMQVGEASIKTSCNDGDDKSDISIDKDEHVIDRSGSDSSGPQKLCENLADTRDGFIDPFPVLSPMPTPNSTRSSIQSKFNKNKLKVQTIPRELITPNISQQPPVNTPVNFYPRNNKTNSMNRAPYTTPPMSRVGTPQPLLSSGETSPINSTTSIIGRQHSWMDPFPSPDASVRSSRLSTPFSSRVKSSDYGGSDIALNEDWERLLESVPRIPDIEELRRLDNNKTIENKSCPRLQSMDVCPRLQSMGITDLLPVRKIVSESNMRRRSSWDNIWGALKSGPDGNELITEEYDNPEPTKMKKRERRNSEKSLIFREALESQDKSEITIKPLRRRRSKQKLLERNLSASVEPSWKGLQSPLMASSDNNDDEQNERTDELKLNTINNSANGRGHLIRNSSTITNVTGADLAKEVKKIIHERKGSSFTNGPLTPNRISYRAWRAIKSSKAVANAGELVFSPVKTVRNTSRRASTFVQNTREKLKKRKEARRLRRIKRMKEPPPSWWIVIPADHPYKIAWDVLTMVWAMLGAYRTHVRIRDRVFDQSPLILLTEVWFTLDILLNFVTEHKTGKGQVIRDGKAVWARYLTTWFIFDILSLIPWERIYVRPVVERIKKRNVFQKTFFRSKAVVRVSRVLRGRHIKLFGRVSKHTGTPLGRMVKLVIKYLPKYLVFLRNMKGALVVRALRFVHWLHNMYTKLWVKTMTARESYTARRAARGSIIDLFGARNASTDEHDSSSDSSDDEDDIDEDEDVSEDDSLQDERPLAHFHRAQSDRMPVRRRSYSMHD